MKEVETEASKTWSGKTFGQKVGYVISWPFNALVFNAFMWVFWLIHDFYRDHRRRASAVLFGSHVQVRYSGPGAIHASGANVLAVLWLAYCLICCCCSS